MQQLGRSWRGIRFCQLRAAFWGAVVTYLGLELSGLCAQLHAESAATAGIFRLLLFAAIFGVLSAALALYARSRRLMRVAAQRLEEDVETPRHRFLSHLNHEIRTPLNAVTGFAGLIAGMPDDKLDLARCRQYARRILEAGMELERLADNLVVQLARCLEAQGHSGHQVSEVAGLMAELRSHLSSMAEARGRRLTVSVRPGVERLKLAGGREALFALVGNLAQVLLQICPQGDALHLVALSAQAENRLALRFVLPPGVGETARPLLEAIARVTGGHAWHASTEDPLIKLLATRLLITDSVLKLEPDAEEPDGLVTLLLPLADDDSRPVVSAAAGCPVQAA